MSNSTAPNDLDRAIMAVIRSRAAMPDLCPELIKGELWFLMPRRPGEEDEVIELKPGSPLPFVILADAQGPVVPIFSSAARLDESLKNNRVPGRTYTAGAMPAVQLLEILGRAELRAIINKSCATGELTIPPDLMRGLADGTTLKPRAPDKEEERTLQKLDPADYPTDLIQRAFEVMRRHPSFRAAWVFGYAGGQREPGLAQAYHLVVLMHPRDDVAFRDLDLVVHTVSKKTYGIEVGVLYETDAASIAMTFRQAQPFYIAPDYHPPQPGLLGA
jgi:hypothetical protein